MAQNSHQAPAGKDGDRKQQRGGETGAGHGRSGQEKVDRKDKQYEGGYEGDAQPGGDYQSGDAGGKYKSGGYAGGFDHPEDFEGGPYQGGEGWGGPDTQQRPPKPVGTPQTKKRDDKQ